MIYLDYSATTVPNDEVLNTFLEVSKRFIGNPNSIHKLGFDAKKLIDASTKQISEILKVSEKEIIYTSGATESNNMAIYGVINKYKNRGNKIITTRLEHSSISAELNYLKGLGYIIEYVKIDEYGNIDINNLKELLDDNTILVTISSVNSETGQKQDLKKIRECLKNYPKIIFHSDVTQSIGKEDINLSYVDLASFSAQKFYGLKGIGCLIKNKNIELVPLIKGGKSTTIYRSGTPSAALIASLAKALRLAYEELNKKYEKVQKLNTYLKHELEKIKNIHINSTNNSIPHILNISIDNIKPETLLHALEQHDIYISTKTACSNNNDYSDAVYELTKNMEYAKHSLRISISYLTTEKELEKFVEILKKEIEKLSFV